MLPYIFSDIRGVIFDMDGTIIDSMKLHRKVWHEIATRYGSQLSEEEVGERMHGINEEIIERLFPGKLTELGKQKMADEKENLFRKRFDPENNVIEGVITFLEVLKNHGIPCVLGSAAPPENVDFVFDALGLRSFFDGIIHENHVVEGKPNPDVFIKAASLIGVPVEQCVVFEDSTSGAEASAAAGCKTIVVLSSKAKTDFKDISGILTYIKDYKVLLEQPGKESASLS